MENTVAPPPVVSMARVIAYAVLDETVQWTGKQKLFVGGERLGPVPRLVIAQDSKAELPEALIFFCDEAWEVLGIAGAESVETAKERVEAWYRGATAKWQDANVTTEQAQAWIRENEEYVFCLFCGKKPVEVKSMAIERLGAICNECVDVIHGAMHESDTGQESV